MICDEIGVLYLGNLMEIADADKLYSNPLHPYTKIADFLDSGSGPESQNSGSDRYGYRSTVQIYRGTAASITAVRGVRNAADRKPPGTSSGGAGTYGSMS